MASKRKPWGSGVLELPKDKIKRLEKIVESANEALNRLVKEKLDLEYENISLRQEKEELLENIEAVKADRDKADQERNDLDNKVTTLGKELQVKEHLVKKFREQVEAKDQNIISLLEESRKLQKKISELEQNSAYWERKCKEEEKVAGLYYNLPAWATRSGVDLTNTILSYPMSTIVNYLEAVNDIQRKLQMVFDSKIQEMRNMVRRAE